VAGSGVTSWQIDAVVRSGFLRHSPAPSPTRVVRSCCADERALWACEVLFKRPLFRWKPKHGQRFIAMRWDDSLPPVEAAKKAGAPAAWQQLGRQAIMPERMR
jgi:hypothetical protein